MKYLILAAVLFFGGFYHENTLAYEPHSSIDRKVWETALPYLLPEELPIKTQLDTLFGSQRATFSIKSMKKAGFINPYPRKWTRLIVTKHPDFPGYVFKMYLDTQRNHNGTPEYRSFIHRIQGVEEIASLIRINGWEDLFKTPKKWIYPLPEDPAPPGDFRPRYFILVEEDMEIVDEKTNYALWNSKDRDGWNGIDQETLEKLFVLLEASGLHDSKPDNIPYSRDGKLAFIDTQQIHAWPVLYKKISSYLSPELLPWWKSLIQNARKKPAL